MFAPIRAALVMLGVFTLLLGVAYPLGLTAAAQLMMPWRANGSLIADGGRVVGSVLIGQAFVSDRYFHGRPSATATPYDAAASGGSNLGPLSSVLIGRVGGAVASRGDTGPVPADAVTTSASGLDPHISPRNAAAQVGRVASARGLPEQTVRALLATHVERPALGFIGELRVNVLMLNIALDKLSGG